MFHGYLLRGTGSNIYNAGLASALVRLGHEVHLLCQDRHAAALDFVGEVGDWDSGQLICERLSAARCTVYRPDVARVLPVFVHDRYEGLDARPFPTLSDAELGRYIDANVKAVVDVTTRVQPDIALANHVVMGPLILARALAGTGVPYVVKVHGSDLEYAVKPHPRFLAYAREGLAGATAILVGSHSAAENLWATVDDPPLRGRTRVAPPGIDVDLFAYRQRERALRDYRGLVNDVGPQTREPTHGGPARDRERASTFARDEDATANALSALADRLTDNRLVVFIGKLIAAKGFDLLLVAWPLVLAAMPNTTLAVAGFGSESDLAQDLVDALSTGYLEAIATLVSERPAAATRLVGSFLDSLDAPGERDRYLAAAPNMREQVVFTGRLEHPELAALLPLCEAIVVPSTSPESFGMVATEAAACGVLPITTCHSALAELSRELGHDLTPRVRRLQCVALGPDVVRGIATSVIEWLHTAPAEREPTRRHLAETVRRRYSWDRVARDVLEACGAAAPSWSGGGSQAEPQA